MKNVKRQKFLPKNPKKYAGDVSNIFARSKLELIYMAALDTSPIVHRWICEPKNFNIRYVNPKDNKVHTYWPDFLIQYVNGKVDLVEIKPLKYSLNEAARTAEDKLELMINQQKWKAAEAFAKSIRATFRVITEKNLLTKRNKR